MACNNDNVSGEQLNEILTRLSSLETSSREADEVILSLQKDNITLQRDVLRTQRDNNFLKEEMGNMKADVAAMKKAVVESKRLKERLKKFDSLCADVVKLEQRTKVMDLGFRNKEKKTEEQMTQLNDYWRILNRAMVTCHKDNDLENEIKELSQRICPLERRASQISKSEVLVEFDTTNQNLALGKLVKLDKCLRTVTDGSGGRFFDPKSCQLRAEVEGHYLMNVVFEQSGKGKIRMTVNNAGGNFIYVGQTTENNPEVSTTAILKLSPRSAVWLEARCEEGDAKIEWCDLYARLL